MEEGVESGWGAGGGGGKGELVVDGDGRGVAEAVGDCDVPAMLAFLRRSWIFAL